jgi:dihydroorotate dehydrogenase (NAD+) catalytic subunit
VALIPDGAVNAVGLTNPGFKYWMKCIYPVARRQGNIIVSICPYDVMQARWMGVALNRLRDIVGIEVNLSCPNVDHVYDPVAIMEAVRSNTDHNLIAKVGIDQLEVCQKIEKMVDAFDAINSVKWGTLFKTPSPLARYGLEGGVSGGPIRDLAREAASCIRRNTNKPVISGGGIGSVEEVYARHVIGAGAVSLGTQAFLREPWMANLIADICRSEMGGKDGRNQDARVAKEVYAALTRRLPSLLEGCRSFVSGILDSSRRGTKKGRPGVK